MQKDICSLNKFLRRYKFWFLGLLVHIIPYVSARSLSEVNWHCSTGFGVALRIHNLKHLIRWLSTF